MGGEKEILSSKKPLLSVPPALHHFLTRTLLLRSLPERSCQSTYPKYQRNMCLVLPRSEASELPDQKYMANTAPWNERVVAALRADAIRETKRMLQTRRSTRSYGIARRVKRKRKLAQVIKIPVTFP